MLYKSILETIGQTPMVRLNKVTSHLPCTVWAKCEFFNPGGSVKDRIGYNMVMQAEREGRITPGDTLIEPTSGNTGIGIALAGAVRGYQVIITMPEKMSQEKQVVLEALGARIIRTPTEAAFDAPDSHISVARRLEKELPNAHILDQYNNPENPLAHYNTTAQEILDDLDGRVDMIVVAAGTGGTITGVARKIKEECPKCIIIGADPIGSILAGPGEICSYKVEGIGYDFIPDVLDTSLVDRWVKTNDRQSFLLARRLIKEEGLLVGGSSGAVMHAVLSEAHVLRPDANCVAILADGVRNYLTKFVDNKWMMNNHFFTHNSNMIVGEVTKNTPPQDLFTLDVKETAAKAIKIMRERSFSQIPITKDAKLVGILNENQLLEHLTCHQSMSTMMPVSDLMQRNVPTIHAATPLNALQDLLQSASCVVLIDQNKKPIRVITKIDLVEWLTEQSSHGQN